MQRLLRVAVARRQISRRAIDLVRDHRRSSACGGGRRYQKSDNVPAPRVCASLFSRRRARVCVFTRAVDDNPSTNRNARSGITPPSILGSRHFLPRTAFPLRNRNGFFFLSMNTDDAAAAPVPVLRRVRPAHIAPVFRSLRPAIRETSGLL